MLINVVASLWGMFRFSPNLGQKFAKLERKGTKHGKMGTHAWNVNKLVYFSMDYRVVSFFFPLDYPCSDVVHNWCVIPRSQPTFINIVTSPITFATTKASFFILYLQLFQPLEWIKIFSWIGLVLDVCGYLAWFIVLIYRSVPRPGEHIRTLINADLIPLGLGVSIFGLLLDLLILALPVIAVSNLRMSKKKRFGAALVFLTGSL